uniref:C-type lectin domain-containing protein n=1 Tax=Astyanax mexicanus TaxID=7994 RepID=A0A3B1KFX9_ASTMX
DKHLSNDWLRYKIPLILIKEKKTWWEALRYCRENHVDLVSVHTEGIQRWVETVARNTSTDNVWVGLRHTCDLNWIWSDESDSSYSNWIPGEPNNYNIFHNCVELRSENTYQWNDAGCYHKNKFICYKGE